MIITNEAALRIKCEDATLEEATSIVEQLDRELNHSSRMGRPGIGLAAIQIGIPKNVAIVRLDNNYKVDLVNCKIEKTYDKIMFRGEGCLSYPGRIEDTMRYNEIYVKNNLVYPHSFTAVGLFAIICQHEMDHLNNILLPDIAIKKVKTNVGPNDPCICGKIDPLTGKVKKFKKCCKGKNVK